MSINEDGDSRMKAAVYAATRELYPDLAPSIKALLLHSDVEKIFLVIEDDAFPEWLPPLCETVNVSGQKLFPRSGPNYDNPWTWMVLMRAAYYRMFPQLDRILSIDADAFALKDISGLWELDLSRSYLAAVRETSPLDSPELPYYNVGVMVQNLDLLRRSGRGDEVLRTLQKRKWKYPEQDAFNAVCSGGILGLPREYNAGRGTEPYGDPVIRHFMGEQATYRDEPIVRHYRELPWEEVLRCRS